MRIGKIVDTLTALYKNDATRHRTVFLIGKSGVGKSATVRQTAEALGIPLIDLRLSQFDPVDFRGVPYIDDETERTSWAVPEFFPDETQPNGILFLDELTSAPHAVQAVAYQMCLDRRVGDYYLPDGWMIVAAGNHQSDRGVTHTIPSPLLNRMTRIEVETTVEDVVMHGAKMGVRPEVLAFMQARADLLHKFDAKNSAGMQFPTPRGWFAVSDKFGLNLPTQTFNELVRGDVGEEAGVAFTSFLSVWETLPAIEEVLRAPDAAPVPEELNKRYCLVMGLAAQANKDNFDRVVQYVSRMPNDLLTLVGLLAIARDKEIMKSPGYIQWASSCQHAFARG